MLRRQPIASFLSSSQQQPASSSSARQSRLARPPVYTRGCAAAFFIAYATADACAHATKRPPHGNNCGRLPIRWAVIYYARKNPPGRSTRW